MFLEDNKIPLSMLRLSFLDKAKFTGSYKDKRYMFEKSNDNDKNVLLLHIYPDRLCYEKTDKKDIKTFTYAYDNDGIRQGLEYLSSIFDER